MPRTNASLKLTVPREVVRELAAEARSMNVSEPRVYASLVLEGIKPQERRRAYVRALRAGLDGERASLLDVDAESPA